MTVERLRAISGYPGLPVALCSGHEWLDALATATGAVAAYRKPFNLDAIVALVARYVQRTPA